MSDSFEVPDLVRQRAKSGGQAGLSTGLANLQDFDDDESAMFLQVAERCL